MKRIKVDIPSIKEYLRENGMTQVDVCRRIGRSPNFLCSCTGDMAEYTYDLLIQVLGVEDGAFQKKEKDLFSYEDYKQVRLPKMCLINRSNGE